MIVYHLTELQGVSLLLTRLARIPRVLQRKLKVLGSAVV